MSPRLAALASRIKPCESLIDIGCDHGKISKYVYDNGLSKRVIASDISEKSLNKAKKLLENTDVLFRVGDGLSALNGEQVDAAVIAGMGGYEIIKILSHQTKPNVLYLLPHKNAVELRAFLLLHYHITYDATVREGNRFYDVIEAHKCLNPQSGHNIDFGVTDLASLSPDFILRLKTEREKLERLQAVRHTKERHDRLTKILEVLNGKG